MNCKNKIKNKIKYTNILCRITLLRICGFLFGVKMCDPLRLMSNAFLYTTRRENIQLC